ncbi:hypothetical protein F5J12DRAFT_821737 [Pisolithus orientalis]|uniref:uncharacterized protein n=1 Tax=Pisolithus orientalis TaxID=936130 RepID=UPI00222516C8|nr:uncharacterized protein F5J12DRAFT_821737 [Pisolithus orientalis]KAI6010793.1 hypothetical protein F5J12DRAFT_821737 [Pisolithus orientalis]
MREAVDTSSDNLNRVLGVYQPASSIEDEFPSSTDYRDLKYNGNQVSAETMMRDLLTVITDMIKGFNLQNIRETPDLCNRYAHLVIAVLVLKRSRLLRWLCQEHDVLYHKRKLEAEKLKRRLAKVAQYYNDISTLIEHAQRRFSQGINHRWVGRMEGTCETRLDLDENYMGVISRALGGVPLAPETATALHEKVQNMRQVWDSSRSVTTRLHAEIRILLHLSNPVHALDHTRQQPIGCSKRSCLCCTVWIWKYNKTFRTKWLTSGSHGKPYAAWALPGFSYDHVRVSGGRSDIDAAVLLGVGRRLSRTLAELFPNQRRLSDEHRSSESEEEGRGSERQLYHPRAIKGWKW